jgi:hypothetical protein
MASPAFDTSAFDTGAFDTGAYDLETPTPPATDVGVPFERRRRRGWSA